jgi:hypothetical protein
MIRFYIFIWPFYLPFKLWNPFRKKDRRTGATIEDIFSKRRSQAASQIERKRRQLNGEEQKKCFSCKTIRSVNFEGK